MAHADPDATASAKAAPAPTLTRGFLFSDLRGYTAFVEARGAAAGAELLDRYRRLVRVAVARHLGAEIKTEGDSFYVVFSSVTGAVQCALDIVRETAEEERDDATPAIQVGIGVNAGETVETPEGFVGTAVNLAARLCAAASAGEVLVSQTVRDLTSNTADVRFEFAGRRRLKGIADPVAVHRATAGGTWPRMPSARHPRARAVAVTALGTVLVAGALAGLALTGTLARLAGSGGRASSSPSSSPRSTIAVTKIVIPAYVDGLPDPTPVPLVPGTYRLTAFHPGITFSIDRAGWTAAEDAPDTFQLLGPNRSYLIGALVQVVSSGPCPDAPMRLLDQTPHGLVEWLQGSANVKVSDPLPVTAGGYAGLSVEISPEASPTGCASGGPPGSVTMFKVGDHVFSLRPDEHVQVITLDVRGQPVTLLVGASGADFETTTAAAGSIIQSLLIAP